MARKIQRTYETVIVYNPDLPEEEVTAFGNKVQEIINSNEGLAGPVRYWGKFKLAYRIRKFSQGHYTHVVYNANSNTIAELERNLKIWGHVIRYFTVKISDNSSTAEALAKLSQEAIIPSPEDIIVSEIEDLAEVGVYTGSRPRMMIEEEFEEESEAYPDLIEEESKEAQDEESEGEE